MNIIGLFDYLCLGFIILFIILWLYCIFKAFIQPYYRKIQKPKFRKIEYGLVEYYSPYFDKWRPFYIWSDKSKERIIHIIDRIREIEFDYKYIGEGRERIDYDQNKKCWDYFKTAKEVDDNQIILIDKENDYFRNILKNN